MEGIEVRMPVWGFFFILLEVLGVLEEETGTGVVDDDGPLLVWVWAVAVWKVPVAYVVYKAWWRGLDRIRGPWWALVRIPSGGPGCGSLALMGCGDWGGC